MASNTRIEKDHTLPLELGLSGCNTWQTTDDQGDDAPNNNHDNVHGIGPQLGVTYLPWALFGPRGVLKCKAVTTMTPTNVQTSPPIPTGIGF